MFSIQGTFKNPPPGQPRSQVPKDPVFQLGQEVTDLHDSVARGNFRVVIIIPEEVERVDLSNIDNARRWKWTLTDDEVGTDSSQPRWVETELWP